MIRQKTNKLKNIKNLIKQLDKIENIKDNPQLLDKFILETKDNLICQELKVEMEIVEIRLQNRSKKESKGDKKFALKLSKELQSAATASSIKEKFIVSIYIQAKTYKKAIKGTTFSVTDAILLIPPIIINPTIPAIIKPIIAPALVLSKPKSCLIARVAVLDCAAFPPPKDPPIQNIANNDAATVPNVLKPLDFNPLLI